MIHDRRPARKGECSTPGGVIGIGTLASVRGQSATSSVLNAWRRHWNRHAWFLGYAARAVYMCSTPGGVIGIGTRLDNDEPVKTPLCSTPGGVIGIGTPEGSNGFPDRCVLNAWRRHWNRHANHRQDRIAGPRQCSTPGGVIGIGTQSRPPARAYQGQCSTPGGVIGIGTPASKADSLISVGAQRLAASLESARGNFPRRECLHKAVLNAWRRHWNRHWAMGFVAWSYSLLCSTPGGVIGIGTVCVPRSSVTHCSAQRLAASLESAQS